MKAFKPPEPQNPPLLVQVDWIDAVAEVDYDGKAAEAGGLTLVPAVGYHVRTVKRGKLGAFIVIAREWTHDDGVVLVRDTHSIPTGWVRAWTVMNPGEQVYPEPGTQGNKPGG